MRCLERRRHGQGVSFIFDAGELASDLAALPPCLAAGCEALALSPSGLCTRHARVASAHLAERALLGDPDRDWYTEVEATAAAGVSTPTLARARRRGEISATRVGRHLRYDRAEVAGWRRTWTREPSKGPRRGQPRRRLDAAELQRRRHQVGKLFAEGETPCRIARLIGWSKPTILSDLDALGLERPRGRRPRVLDPGQRETRRREAGRLYLGGLTLRAIAQIQESSPTQVARDLRALGVELRPGRPPTKYPAPHERDCLNCGQAFTPTFPSYGRQRFCSDVCARAARTAARELELERRQLIGTRQAGERLGVGEHRVLDYIGQGWLVAERISFPYALQPSYGIRLDELDRFEREWVRAEGRLGMLRAPWLDPDYVVCRWEAAGWLARYAAEKGLSLAEATAIVRNRVEHRRRNLVRHRSGRKRSDSPPACHLRWLERFPTASEELRLQHTEELELGLPTAAPTQWQVALAVAEADWREFPEDWPRASYPAARDDPEALASTMARAAANRVQTAVKRLQNAHTEKTAA